MVIVVCSEMLGWFTIYNKCGPVSVHSFLDAYRDELWYADGQHVSID